MRTNTIKILLACLLWPTATACDINNTAQPEPAQCINIDFSSGFIDSNRDYYQEPFLVQFVLTPEITATIENGELVFSTDSTALQWFMVLKNPGNQKFYFDFRSIELKALSMSLTFVGDKFDTLRVNEPGVLVIPDSLFVGTTQVHVFGTSSQLIVDNIVVCDIR